MWFLIYIQIYPCYVAIGNHVIPISRYLDLPRLPFVLEFWQVAHLSTDSCISTGPAMLVLLGREYDFLRVEPGVEVSSKGSADYRFPIGKLVVL